LSNNSAVTSPGSNDGRRAPHEAADMKRVLILSTTIVAFVVAWMARPSTTESVLVDRGSVWKYLDNGSNQSTTWRTVRVRGQRVGVGRGAAWVRRRR
jgi:hypothetical protein